ncbi:MAG TPA: nucleotidyltransferase family protein, partial [Burkholderiales bacterium]|nr:nucleotidyltransferase family protein [Burkholderiales bacterium]
TYANIGIFHPQLFDGMPRNTKLRLFPPMFDYVRAGRVTAEQYHGCWFNVGTPDHLAELDRLLKEEALTL